MSNVIDQIETVVARQVASGSPVYLLHLTDEHLREVEAYKAGFPVGPETWGLPTPDDRRPRYKHIPLERSFRDFSFAAAYNQTGGQVRPINIPLESPNLAF